MKEKQTEKEKGGENTNPSPLFRSTKSENPHCVKSSKREWKP